MVYKVKIKKKAIKYLSSLRKNDSEKIIIAIEALSKNPKPIGHKKLSGVEAYRIRIGNYRVIYEIEGDALLVYIVKVGSRGDVYK